MAYATNELKTTNQSWTAQARTFASSIEPKTFAPGTGTLAIMTPVAFNTSLSQWVVWSDTDGANEVDTLTVTATASTFTVTIQGETSAGIAYNANAATIQAALEALGAVDIGGVVVTGTGPFTLTFGGNLAKTAITITASGATITEVTAGSASVGKSTIKGFVWPDAIALSGDTANAVLGNVMMAGQCHYDDIALPTGEVAGNLQTALRTQARPLGIKVQGLTNVR